MKNATINRADLIVTPLFWITSLRNVLIVALVAEIDARRRKMMPCLMPVRKDRYHVLFLAAGIDAYLLKLADVRFPKI